jgi:hypothetical protein
MNVFGLGTLGAGHKIELDLLARVKSFKSVSENGGVMHEDILPLFLGNETEPF